MQCIASRPWLESGARTAGAHEHIVEAYERTCVENNAGHGQVSVVGVTP
jgi:hypothetical protein